MAKERIKQKPQRVRQVVKKNSQIWRRSSCMRALGLSTGAKTWGAEGMLRA